MQKSEEATDMCNDILDAARMTDLAIMIATETLNRASTITQRTIFERLPYSFRVIPDLNLESYVSINDKIIEHNPTEFYATQVRSIGQRGIEFYNRRTDRSLKIVGYRFDISPVFDEPGPVAT